jgi:hypothetical protein
MIGVSRFRHEQAEQLSGDRSDSSKDVEGHVDSKCCTRNPDPRGPITAPTETAVAITPERARPVPSREDDLNLTRTYQPLANR